MRDVEIELRVRNAVKNLRDRGNGEDDAIEFKSAWPNPPTEASRQLAGGANRRAGQPLMVVIGIHDRTGVSTKPDAVEPKDWYAQAVSKFDEKLAPDLAQTLIVTLDDGDSVVVMVFDTDRFPYVVDVPGKTGFLEVPLRVGTGTRSAHRRELVRLLEPTVRLPAIEIERSMLEAYWFDGPSNRRNEDGNYPRVMVFSFEGTTEVALAHVGEGSVTLPVRAMRARVVVEDRPLPVDVHVLDSSTKRVGPDGKTVSVSGDFFEPPRLGVYVQKQQVVGLSPGTFRVKWKCYRKDSAPSDELSEWFELFERASTVRLDLAVHVVGVSQVVKRSVEMARTHDRRPPRVDEGTKGNRVNQYLGSWQFKEQMVDPWDDEA